jgi:hypothetical protein
MVEIGPGEGEYSNDYKNSGTNLRGSVAATMRGGRGQNKKGTLAVDKPIIKGSTKQQ